MRNSLLNLRAVAVSAASVAVTVSAFMALTMIAASYVGCNKAYASGFELWEQDSAGAGDYHAGAAVDTDNTGIEYYNPAGMVFLTYNKPQFSTGVAYIPINTSFNGWISLNGGTHQHTDGWVNSSTENLVPNFHAIYPVSPKWAFGLGVTTPFGLSTDYPELVPVGYAATKTKLITININPSVAYKITHWFGVGFGVDAQYGEADFDSLVPIFNYPSNNHLTGWAWGWNAGAYFKPSVNSALGVSYRSEVTFHAHGKGTTTDIITPHKVSVPIKARLPLPATLTISGEQHFNKLTILTTVERTWWSRFDNLVMTGVPNPMASGSVFNLTAPFGYSDTWNIAVGMHYWLSPRFMLKLGGGYDMTPTNDKYRDIRLPGTNRWAAAIGARALLSRHIIMDMAWIHLIPTKEARINNKGPHGIPFIPPPPTLIIRTNGKARMSGDVIGLQLTALF